jgi:hypothetical protein
MTQVQVAQVAQVGQVDQSTSVSDSGERSVAGFIDVARWRGRRDGAWRRCSRRWGMG